MGVDSHLSSVSLVSFFFFFYHNPDQIAQEGNFYPRAVILFFILICILLLLILLLCLFWQVSMILLENAEVLLQSDAVKLRAAHLKTRLETLSKQEILKSP